MNVEVNQVGNLGFALNVSFFVMGEESHEVWGDEFFVLVIKGQRSYRSLWYKRSTTYPSVPAEEWK